jgi:hypothetical protein
MRGQEGEERLNKELRKRNQERKVRKKNQV